MMLPRFFSFENYEVVDVKEFLSDGRIDVYLCRDKAKLGYCCRCGGAMGAARGDHAMKVQAMPIMGYKTFIHFRRYKYHCPECQKARSEKVPFLSELTPHLTQDYAWWVGRLCEIAAVSRVAELVSQDGMTVWRLDFHRMIEMLAHYKIPNVRRITVDEVYARKKSKYPNESRDNRFFTVISDLDTRKVIWVADSRRKEALDGFFEILGKQACEQIEVVAVDQHEGYAASVRQHCKKATIVWDKFHIMQNFEEAVNETRKDLYEELAASDPIKKLTRGKYRFLFLKRACTRTEEEKQHLDDVMKNNELFYKLELIKERMLTFFDESDESQAKNVFDELGSWIWLAGFKPLMKWHNELEKGWETLKNYFTFRVTSSLAEGINNVIKMLKRRAFGYRNMGYFKLKIMQVCGYLNSRFIPTANQLVTQK
jgi:transposase